jgi:dephospho-CoA kinase
MKVYQITGGIGSGKSTVSKFLKLLGLPLFEADKAAKWLCNHNLSLKNQIIQLMGQEAYTPDQKYNTSFISKKVFSDPSLLSQLNALIHPAVHEFFEEWKNKNEHHSLGLYEAALLNPSFKKEETIWIKSPIHLRIKRILKRDPQRSVDQINEIIKKQATSSDFESRSNFTIENDEKQSLIAQILNLYTTIKA